VRVLAHQAAPASKLIQCQERRQKPPPLAEREWDSEQRLASWHRSMRQQVQFQDAVITKIKLAVPGNAAMQWAFAASAVWDDFGIIKDQLLPPVPSQAITHKTSRAPEVCLKFEHFANALKSVRV
jgi:hypothetical protein